MQKITIDQMKNCSNSIYKLAIITAKRAQELSQGASPLMESPIGEKPTVTALREIVNSKVGYKVVPKE